MSKVIVLPLLAAAGMGAAWVAKKGKDFWDSISPEHRRFLLPLGAGRDRLQLEAATVSYRPMEGFEFETSLPSFEMPEVGADGPRYLPTPVEGGVNPGVLQLQALERVASEAKALGFDAQQRAGSSASNIVVLDLTTLADVRENVREPVPVH